MKSLYDNVFIKKINYVIPGINKNVSGIRVLTSELEERVMKAMSHLPFKVPEGCIKFYTDVKERYFWKEDVNLVKECQELMKQSMKDIDIQKIKSVRYGTLTRQFIEPATATMIMSCLPFSKDAVPFDTPNACLGMTNSIITVANEIQLKQTEYGLVIGFEDSRQVVIDTLKDIQEYYQTNSHKKYWRENIPTLTLGSGALSIILGNDSGICRIKGFVAMNDSSSSELCIGRYVNGRLLMKTDAEKLQKKGVEIVKESVSEAMKFFGWTRVNMVVTHQVGKAHQRDVEENLSSICDNCKYVTFPEYGNMGSLSMPFTLAKAYEDKVITQGNKVLAIGFGSGLVSCILGLEF